MSEPTWTASRLKAIGRRLCKGTASAADETIFEQYIDAHAAVLEEVSDALGGLGLAATPRLKTRKTLLEKVDRGTDLARMEDIAGLRLPPCEDWHAQDELARVIVDRFPGAHLRDRRVTPSAGYRAVHVIVRGSNGCAVEIQIRTRLQQAWAEVFEKFTEVGDRRNYRYGAVPTDPEERSLFEVLLRVADSFAYQEDFAEKLRQEEAASSGRTLSEREIENLAEMRTLMTKADQGSREIVAMLPGVLEEFEANQSGIGSSGEP